MEATQNITLAIVTGSAIIFLLIVVIILFIVFYSKKLIAKEAIHQLTIKNKELDILRVAIETQEAEREKIARNIHDEIGPLISTLKFNIDKYKRDLVKNELKKEDLQQATEMIEIIAINTRSVSHDLAPQFLLKHGLTVALKSFVSTITSIDVDFKTTMDESFPLSKPISINIYRIALELINNTMKYDQPEKMVIELLQAEKSITFRLVHDKKGMTNSIYQQKINEKNGLGLESIQARLIVLNGTIDYSYVQNQTIVEVQVPLNTLSHE